MAMCPFVGTEVPFSIDGSIPVECPVCGSIRTIPGEKIQDDSFTFLAHIQPDGGKSNRKKKTPPRRYKRVGHDEWEVVEGTYEFS